MKRLRIGFLAVIAIAAMSFTIASLSTTKKATTDCFRPKNTGSIDLIVKASNCPNPTITISNTSSCSTAASGQHIWSLDVNNKFTSSQVSSNCPGGSTFCCLKVVEDLAPCSNQDQFDIGAGLKFYKVDAVFCKI
jgi:hypothetical protein